MLLKYIIKMLSFHGSVMKISLNLPSVCPEEMQTSTVDTNDVIIEYITDAQGRKIKKLKPLLIKMEPDREYIQHVNSDNNLPDVPENNL